MGIIAVDYDNTYDAARSLFNDFINRARLEGHEIHIVTMRRENEPVRLGCTVDGVHYTNRKAKRPFMEAKGVYVHIWIDDMPECVSMDYVRLEGR
jgi:hypothetical protein